MKVAFTFGIGYNETSIAEKEVCSVATNPQHHWVSVEEYMELDQISPVRYEYWEGQLVAMSGGNGDHALIATNIIAALRHQIKAPCRLYNSDLKVQITADKFLLPDVHVTCDPADLVGKIQAVRSPRLVVEVLSPTTERADRGRKFFAYQRLPSMQEYVLVNYRQQLVEVFRREQRKWSYEIYQSGETVELVCLNLTIPVDVIYEETSIPIGGQLDTLEDEDRES
jgi:Uma2 family endonuclease